MNYVWEANAEFLYLIYLFDCLLVRLKNQASLSKSIQTILQVLLMKVKSPEMKKPDSLEKEYKSAPYSNNNKICL